ncbi:uncharacterized protein [Rutidosis leptorrhynchoides]|uniref:uncharacterized protein n=1 Tax=Rutidosis leptorrhynchoides TaxID=125765 RepID=UPI003A99F7DA
MPSPSWGWRKILHLRDIIREFMFHKVGNGRLTSIWFDSWMVIGPLSFISTRDMHRAALSPDACVQDIIVNSGIAWTNYLLLKYPLLNDINVLVSEVEDVIVWKVQDSSLKQFSIILSWNSIQPRATLVSWFSCVWFSQCIPRHAFCDLAYIGGSS